MPPRREKKQKKERFRCDEIEGEQFHATVDDVFRYNWWEVFCFPYILCARLWDCCVSLCAGTNQCLVYWMMIQWIVCKITRLTTPDPIIFPYYFYMFCQVILLTVLFGLIWHWIGKSVVIPYFKAYINAFASEEIPGVPKRNMSRLAFRRYCFRKGEIFDTPMETSAGNAFYPIYFTNICTVIVNLLLQELLY